MSGSSNGKLIGAGLGGALVMLAIGAAMWPKTPEPAPQVPTPQAEPAAPSPAAEAAAAAEPAAEAAEPAPVPAPSAATAADWPAVPEVGQAAPKAPPPLRFPTTERERAAYVADAVRDIGDIAVQRSLRSARWTFDAILPPVHGRIVVDVNDEVAVLRIAELDTVAILRGDRCMRRAGSLVSDCEMHEEQILQAVTQTRLPLLLGAWLESGAKPVYSAVGSLDGQLDGVVDIRFAVPGGKRWVEAFFRGQGDRLQMAALDSLYLMCSSMILQANRNVGGLALPSVWQFAAMLPGTDVAAPPNQPDADKATGAPAVTTTGEPLDERPRTAEANSYPEEVKKHIAFCSGLRFLLVDVAPITVVVPKLEPLQAESAPRIEKRMAQRLRALAVDSADAIFPAIGNVMSDPTEIDRRGNLLGLVVGKDGLAVATPVVAEASAQAAISLVEVPVVRQRVLAKPTLLVAKMQEFAASVGKTHKIGEGPWIAWARNIDTKTPAWSTSESVFEFEIPIAP